MNQLAVTVNYQAPLRQPICHMRPSTRTPTSPSAAPYKPEPPVIDQLITLITGVHLDIRRGRYRLPIEAKLALQPLKSQLLPHSSITNSLHFVSRCNITHA
jgi:hypothetical protein